MIQLITRRCSGESTDSDFRRRHLLIHLFIGISKVSGQSIWMLSDWLPPRTVSLIWARLVCSANGVADRTIKVWDPQSGDCVQTLVGHRGAVNTLQLSDDMIVSGSGERTCNNLKLSSR